MEKDMMMTQIGKRNKEFKAGDLVTFDYDAQCNKSYPLKDFEDIKNIIAIFIAYDRDINNWPAICTIYFIEQGKYQNLYYDRLKLYES